MLIVLPVMAIKFSVNLLILPVKTKLPRTQRYYRILTITGSAETHRTDVTG
jgi:hypothetical protein